jgi:6-phosphogluconolactonase (cycloisomerase 2 family)
LTSAGDIRDIVFSKDNKQLYMADYSSQSVVSYDVSSKSKSTKCQLSGCRPTSLSVDQTTGGLVVTCADDNKVVVCTADDQIKTLDVSSTSDISKVIDTVALSNQYAILAQLSTNNQYVICTVTTTDDPVSVKCPYTVKQTNPSSLAAVTDELFAVVDQASKSSIYLYGKQLGSKFLQIPTKYNFFIGRPSVIKVNLSSARVLIIDSYGITFYDLTK